MIAVVATTVVASAAGCSSGNKTPAPASTSSAPSSSASGNPGSSAAPAPATPPAAPPPAAPPANITLGGQQMPVTDPVDCNSKDGKFSIAIGQPFIGVIAALEQDASVVHLVGLGEVDGLNYNFNEGAPGQNANATKNGNTYHITGVASGTDNKGKQQAQKPFTIDVTCP
ncbi:MAG TPA: lipoprotein LpqH [Mycobacterium sp.]